jgi:glucosamine-phosphate N-acetyltransferase
MELAKERNCYKVILDCTKNISGFYEKIGFEKHGIQMSKYF